PPELQAKVFKALRITKAPAPAGGAAKPGEAAQPGAEAADKPASVDILLIDDMENVHKKFRTLLPPETTVETAVSAQTAMAVCREKQFRVIIIDFDIPSTNTVVLRNQLRLIQPNASFVCLCLRNTKNDIPDFDSTIQKPFVQAEIDAMRARYFA